jgi:DNA-binding transcriptional LysR family regulator
VDLDDLRVLRGLDELGSFAAVARQLGLARSTLNRRVAALEARFGARLVHVDGTGVRLTAKGELLAVEGRELLAAASTLERRLRAAEDAPEGVVRCAIHLGLHPMAYVASTFVKDEYASLKYDLRFVEDVAPLLPDWADVALHVGSTLPEGPWTARVMQRLPFRLMAARTYLEARPAIRAVADLAAHPVLLWRPIGEPSDRLPRLDGGFELVTPYVRTADFHVARALARGGVGVGFVPSLPLPGEQDDGFDVVLGDEIGEDVPLWVVTRRGMSRTANVVAFLDLIEAATALVTDSR